MIDTVLFDMGGTLEDIWVDDESRHSSIQGVLDILRAHGIDLNMDFETTAQSINAGWERYGAYRDPRQRELKPEEISAIRETLMREDMFIPGAVSADPGNLAARASASASSVWLV